jgi:uncharacterized coiled-coil protein SlyX
MVKFLHTYVGGVDDSSSMTVSQAKDRVSVPPLKLEYLASRVDETSIGTVKQTVQTMQSSMNLSLSSGPAITPRMNPDQTDQSLILSPPGVVKEAARVFDSKARKKFESDIRTSRYRTGSESQQSSFLLNSSIQKDVDPIEDMLEKAREALEEKNQLVASQEEVIRQQKEALDRLEQKLTKRSDALKIITESINARLSAQLPPSSPHSLLPGNSDQINAATSPISEHSPDKVTKKKGIEFSTRKLTQRAIILPLSTPTESGLASSPPGVKSTPKANSQPKTNYSPTYKIQLQRIIGKTNECWLKVEGLEIKIILPANHEFKSKLPQDQYKDFEDKFRKHTKTLSCTSSRPSFDHLLKSLISSYSLTVCSN